MKNIGIDIIENKRITDEIGNRILSKKELELLSQLKSKNSKDEFIAGRWACKEAIIKTFNKKYIFSEIEILKSKNGAPIVFIRNKRNKRLLVSISHEKEYTIAIAFSKYSFFKK